MQPRLESAAYRSSSRGIHTIAARSLLLGAVFVARRFRQLLRFHGSTEKKKHRQARPPAPQSAFAVLLGATPPVPPRSRALSGGHVNIAGFGLERTANELVVSTRMGDRRSSRRAFDRTRPARRK